MRKRKKIGGCGASWGTLLKRVSYGGKKGERAARRCALILQLSDSLARSLT